MDWIHWIKGEKTKLGSRAKKGGEQKQKCGNLN